MELSVEQKKAVEGWVKEGASLSEIQKRLQSEFGLSLTFMDVRLLVIDLGLTLRETKQSSPARVIDPSADATAGRENTARKVAVDVDRVMRPGSLVSGSVTFSDGVKASWFLDEYGRLAIDAGRKKYTPSRSDLEEFQAELQKALEKQGY